MKTDPVMVENEEAARRTGDNRTMAEQDGLRLRGGESTRTHNAYRDRVGTLDRREAMRYNLSQIMKRAWKLFRKGVGTFAECLHRSWISAKAESINAARIEAARIAAGITEEVRTWNGWKQAGYEVKHGERSLFGVDLIYGSKGDGAIYKARLFGASQVTGVMA